ncbi:5'-methylthioadenosine/adenosylhomocysteine nucleosidase [Clostridiaceae bacterium 14S0207]|nr:5'-methylthioadenosine/adenosylhomocysteine nucleosidase [Clostridiaceae bacterium 14S0207]
MAIGIIGAMCEETEKIIHSMVVLRSTKKANMAFNVGLLHEKEVVVVTCGIGKVNAAICTQILIDDFHVEAVINVGIAGGTEINLYPGDVVIGTELVHHDVDTSFFGDKVGQVPRLDTYTFKCDKRLIDLAKEATKEITEQKCYEGPIASGDQFIATRSKLEWIHDTFDAFACEMEGASIAHVAYLNKIPFIVIRSISDNAINGTHVDYEKFKWIAVDNSVKIINNMIKAM